MVSIRRRRLLGLSSGRSSLVDPLPKTFDSGHTPQGSVKNLRLSGVHQNGVSHPVPGSSEKHREQLSASISIVKEAKRRKRYTRRKVNEQEACTMRGVYFKNMKWQAAIKVDKKQIHLGTVASQQEAARLYDRAAFMRGRETNFELAEEVKEQLKKLSWEEYVAAIRDEIISNRQQRRTRKGSRRKVEAVDNGCRDVDEASFSGLEDKVKKDISTCGSHFSQERS